MQFDELVEYIKKELEEGRGENEIKPALRSLGWKEEDINDAFKAVRIMNNVGTESEYSTTSLMKGKELLKRSFNIYKDKFWTLVGIISIPVLGSIVIFILGYLVFGDSFLGYENAVNGVEFSFRHVTFFVITFSLVMVLFIFQQIAMILAVKERDERDVFKLYKMAKDYFVGYLSTGVLFGLIVVGGFLLLIIPGVIFAIFYSMAMVIVIMENLTGMDALRKSKEYVKKDMWGYIKRWGFMVLVLMGTLILISIFVAILTQDNQEAGQNIIDLISWLLAPLSVIYFVELYKNFKALN
ncbi:MAG: YciC family protein [Candidatus Spechtbacterales bacterium]|nr:YciC family protein [Candidatus Spechtbacterales bacterium]